MQQGQTVQVIDALAAKLAVPAAQIWATLVRQVPIEVGKDVVWLACCAVAVYWAVRWWRKVLPPDSGYEESIMPLGLGTLALAVLVVASVIGAITDVGYLFNPQYYALQQILAVLHK